MMEQTATVIRKLDLAEAAVIGDDVLPMLAEMMVLAAGHRHWTDRLGVCRDLLRAVRDEMRREAEGRP